MLWYLLSKPDDWKVKPKDLEQQCGRTRVYRILTELRDAGYLEYSGTQQDKEGKFTSGYYRVIEVPCVEKQHTDTGEEPCVEKPYTENQHAYIKENVQNQESTEKTTDTPTAVSPVAEKPKRARSAKQVALDAMKNALADAYGLPHDTVTATRWNEFGGAGKELLEVGVTPGDIADLFQWATRQKWAQNGFTSYALAKYWPDYAKSRKNPAGPLADTGASPSRQLERAMYGEKS